MSKEIKLLEISNNKAGDITIKIPRGYLRHMVATHNNLPEGSRVTHTKTFSDEVVRQMCSEEEDGTTPFHLMLDDVIDEAIEQGAEGVTLGDEE